jgi:two-component system KDP operon response regulator KdpE
MRMKILVVDSDPRLQEDLGVDLRRQWTAATVLDADSGEAALRLFSAEQPDLVLLAAGPSDPTGLDILREIRQISNVPILMLLAENDEATQIQSLDLGADDCIVPPASRALLFARIKAALRRTAGATAAGDRPDFSAGSLAVWFERPNVTVAGQSVRLTALEFKLLYQLVGEAGHVVPHRVLLDEVWGSEYGATTDHLKVFINRLRSKLQQPGGPRYILTERGLGYRFVRPTPTAMPLPQQPDEVDRSTPA